MCLEVWHPEGEEPKAVLRWMVLGDLDALANRW